jgi:integrase
MRLVSHITYRRDSKNYAFRWVVPAAIRSLLGGKREVKRSLGTTDKRLALRLARRLAVMLERAATDILITMRSNGSTQEAPATYLVVKLLERLVDGSIRMEGVQIDPAKAEEEQCLLSSLLGTSKAKPAEARQTLSDLVRAYFEEGDRAKRWTAKSRQELEALYALMLEVLGKDKPLCELTRKDFAYLKDMLTRLPSNRAKSPLYRTKTVLELASMKLPPDDLLSVTSINKILIRVSSLAKFGVRQGLLANNYAEGMTLAKSKRDDQEREPYNADDMKKLLAAQAAGPHRHPWQEWIPLLLAYQGMRVNEAAQLHLSDLLDVEGILALHINAKGDGKRLKTSNAERIIPIHPELLRLGFLEYVEGVRKTGALRLFPELHLQRDGYGAGVTKWWAHRREKIGLGHRDLHSLRHTVATALREAGVQEDVVADILGHSRSDKETFGRYAKAGTARLLLDALKRLGYGAKHAAPALQLVAA